MKKLNRKSFLLSLSLVLFLGFVSSIYAATKVRSFTCLTGGTTGCIDKISRTQLSNGDVGLVVVGNIIYAYQYNSAATDAEDSPNYIRPDDYSGSGVWYLVELEGKSLITSQDTSGGYTDFYEAKANGTNYVRMQVADSIDANYTLTIPSATGTLGYKVISGTSALGTGAISSGTCASVVTTSATGTATTDVVLWGFNGDPTGVTGYAPAAGGILTIIAYPSSNNVNFKVCNNTGGSITPGAAITLNWRVMR